MSELEFEDIESLRKDLVGIHLAGAAEASGIAIERLRAIESGDEPSVFELEQLARAYGVDVDALFDAPIRIDASDGVGLLLSMSEYRDDLNDWTRARVIRAANAARDVNRLRSLVGAAAAPLLDVPSPDQNKTPYQQGADAATFVRRALSLGTDPIPSTRDLVATRFPSVSVLYARLGQSSLAGLGFADFHRGPSIVLNLQGKGVNPAVRRFSLAHELCHLLLDWNRAEPLASVSGFLGEDESALVREQRANAFATRLICPEVVVRKLGAVADDSAAIELCGRYGLHYGAARLYLRNTTSIQLPTQPRPELRALLSSDAWRAAEAPPSLDGFPIPDVADERRGVLARDAALAYSTGRISRERFASFLGVSTGHDLESVLGYFGLDAPSEIGLGASA